LAEFFQIDMRVTQCGLQGTVAKDIGDQLKTGTTPMGVGGPRVPEDVSPTGSNPASLKPTPNHVAHASRADRATYIKLMMHEERAAFGVRTRVFEVNRQRPDQWVGHGKKPLPSLLGAAQPQCPRLPIDVIQSQSGHFVGSQRQFGQAKGDGVVPLANGSGPGKTA
jgi:hypothetical protein